MHHESRYLVRVATQHGLHGLAVPDGGLGGIVDLTTAPSIWTHNGDRHAAFQLERQQAFGVGEQDRPFTGSSAREGTVLGTENTGGEREGGGTKQLKILIKG